MTASVEIGKVYEIRTLTDGARIWGLQDIRTAALKQDTIRAGLKLGEKSMKLTVGNTMPNFEVTTLDKGNTNLKDVVGGSTTAIYFLRYIGCTICQLDLANIHEGHSKLEEHGAKAVVVLQSPVEKLQHTDFSYDIISDPTMGLYQELEIVAAPSMEVLVGGTSMDKMGRAIASGYSHGEYEGDEHQLPATFIVDEDMKVLYAKYSRDLDDLPTMDELSAFIKKA